MCWDQSLFNHLDIPATGSASVLCANGNKLEIIGKGNITVPLSDTAELNLKDVLLLPGLTQNLISIPKLQDSGYTVLFHGDSGCLIRHRNSTIGSVPRVGNLWQLPGATSAIAQAHLAVTLQELHHKLGHASEEKLLRLIN